MIIGYKYKFFFYTLLSMVIAFWGCKPVNSPVSPLDNPPKIKSETKWLADNQTSIKIKKETYKEFDTKGNLILFIQYGATGKILNKSQYSYTNLQSREEQSFFNLDGNVDSVRIITSTFNTKGKILEKSVSLPDGNILTKQSFNYDLNGNLTQRIVFNSNGNIISQTQFRNSYNPDGNLVEQVSLSPDGKFLTRDSLQYQMNERTVKIISFGADGSVEHITTVQYNQFGLITHQNELNPQGDVTLQYIYEYEYY
jgi:hypothetical protein